MKFRMIPQGLAWVPHTVKCQMLDALRMVIGLGVRFYVRNG